MRHFRHILILCCAILLGGCATLRTGPQQTPVPESELSSWTLQDCRRARKTIVRTARSRIGCKYLYAGKGPDAFDCSGLTAYAYASAGIRLLPSSAQQFTQGRKLWKREALKPGDLVFFGGSKDKETVSHVGIVVSYHRSDRSFTFIHAPSTGVELQKSTTSYYSSRYLGACRLLRDF